VRPRRAFSDPPTAGGRCRHAARTDLPAAERGCDVFHCSHPRGRHAKTTPRRGWCRRGAALRPSPSTCTTKACGRSRDATDCTPGCRPSTKPSARGRRAGFSGLPVRAAQRKPTTSSARLPGPTFSTRPVAVHPFTLLAFRYRLFILAPLVNQATIGLASPRHLALLAHRKGRRTRCTQGRHHGGLRRDGGGGALRRLRHQPDPQRAPRGQRPTRPRPRRPDARRRGAAPVHRTARPQHDPGHRRAPPPRHRPRRHRRRATALSRVWGIVSGTPFPP
jgi:hypothetical protein